MNAARRGRVAMIETLAVFGADVDAVNARSETALMFAVEFRNSTDVVRLLLSLNADVTKVDRFRKTAVQLARSDVTSKLLLEHLELPVP